MPHKLHLNRGLNRSAIFLPTAHLLPCLLHSPGFIPNSIHPFNPPHCFSWPFQSIAFPYHSNVEAAAMCTSRIHIWLVSFPRKKLQSQLIYMYTPWGPLISCGCWLFFSGGYWPVSFFCSWSHKTYFSFFSQTRNGVHRVDLCLSPWSSPTLCVLTRKAQ